MRRFLINLSIREAMDRVVDLRLGCGASKGSNLEEAEAELFLRALAPVLPEAARTVGSERSQQARHEGRSLAP